MSAGAAESNTACPRCGQAFRCGVGDAGPCPCTQLEFDGPTLAELNRQYSGCLCLRCLAELAPAPTMPSG
jgi:hypothetical protein